MPTIYLADDEPVPTRVLSMTLSRQGYAIESFPNGLKALERIREAPPDALITDIEMPVMTGEELCAALNEELPDRRFPIFVVTSVTDLQHRDWAQRMRDLRFVEKPVSMRRLSEQLAAALGQQGLPEQTK